MRLIRHLKNGNNGSPSSDGYYIGDRYRDCDREGVHVYYDIFGTPMSSTSFKNGVMHGWWKLFNPVGHKINGEHGLFARAPYFDGNLHGCYESYNSNGELVSVTPHKHGVCHGVGWSIDENGARNITVRLDGVVIHADYFWDEEMVDSIDDLLNPTEEERAWFVLKYGGDPWEKITR